MTSPPLPPGPADRRRAARFSPDPAPRCAVVPAGREEVKAVVLDLSTTGAGLLVKSHLPSGQDITVRLARTGLDPLTIPGRVVYCAAQEFGAAIVGCQFFDAVSDADLAAVLQLGPP